MRTNYETNKKEATVKSKSEIINITCSEAKTHKKELSKSEESTNKTKTMKKEAHKTEASKSKVITESEVINKTEALTELEANTKSEATEIITKSEAAKAITTSEAITKAEAIKPETIESETMIRQKNYRKPNRKGDNESSNPIKFELTSTKSEANSGTTHKSEDKRKLIVEATLDIRKTKFQKNEDEAKLEVKEVLLQKNEAETKLEVQEAKFQKDKAEAKLDEEVMLQKNEAEEKFEALLLQKNEAETKLNIQEAKFQVNEAETKLEVQETSPSSLTNLSETFQKSLTEDEAIEVFLLSRHFEYDCAKPLKVLPPPNVTIFEFDEKKMKRRIEAIEACPLKKSVRFNIEKSKEFCFSPFNCSSEEEEEEANEEREEGPSLISPPKFLTKEREIVAELNKRLFVHLELVSAVEPKMSIYHNDMHLGDDPSKCRFLVDRIGDCWEIMLIFPNFDTELVGDYVFIASNEGGFDKSKITLKLEKKMASNLDVLQNEEDKPTPKTSTNTNKTLKQIKITTNNIETTQDSPSQNFNKTPKIIEKPAENLELNLIGKEFLNFVIKGDPLPHIEMWIEKQSGNCKIIEPWRKFKLERLQQNKLGVTLLQKSLKLIQVGDIIVLQAINVFGEIITKHVVLNVLSNVLSNVSLLNKKVFVKEQPKIQQEETAPDSPKIPGEKRDEEKKKKKIPSALFIPKASFKKFFNLFNFCF
uniref:Uncharacterized protein n=1 Tax=Meloidogyne enterolobii TaxID=390850 RepID=A0A6V7X5W6_MELEN|nr:unnamed protein product [Meloidogyne enterolobii]